MEATLITHQQSGILYRAWKAKTPRAVFLLIHGLGAQSARWEYLAEFFLQHNISSYALELKGFGETPGTKGDIDSFDIYFNDLRELQNIIKKENPNLKIVLLGESIGALLAFLMAGLKPMLFDALICISPAFKNRLKFTVAQRLDIFSSLLYNPKKQFSLPLRLNMCTQDINCCTRFDADPREHHLATSRLLFNTLIAQLQTRFHKNKIGIPLLFLISANDKVTGSSMSIKIFNCLKTQNKKLILYPDMCHALSIEINREKVFHDILQWTDEEFGGQTR